MRGLHSQSSLSSLEQWTSVNFTLFRDHSVAHCASLAESHTHTHPHARTHARTHTHPPPTHTHTRTNTRWKTKVTIICPAFSLTLSVALADNTQTSCLCVCIKFLFETQDVCPTCIKTNGKERLFRTMCTCKVCTDASTAWIEVVATG